ncbi:uncharacterized protein [Pyrus communis]|uniref:uncharacterized protein n=1 Tax=Pyrus communis TaxID=23211 RepID=UPI0035BFD9D4
MSNLNKLDFTALEVSRRNYLKWVQDVKLHLTTKNLRLTIEEKTDNPIGEAEKATVMVFIQRHIHDALQTEYLAEEDPYALWIVLADNFDHQNDIFLPEARHNWQHLCFQDFKSVNEYNYDVCRIRSLLKFCNETLTEEDLLEKTYSTFYASNIVLQQQYRAQKFTKFSNLIFVLLLAEKQNQLLMKNHQARPTRATVVPEAHYSTNQLPKRKKRHGRDSQKPSHQGQQSRGPSKGGNKDLKRPSLRRPRTSKIRAKHLKP